VHGFTVRDLAIDNPWFSGGVSLTTYELSELLGTKLRALYQRKKGRDLFDLWLGVQHAETSVEDLLESFAAYMAFAGVPATRAQFEANMAAKMQDEAFLGDLEPLLRPGLQYDSRAGWQRVHERIVSLLPGDPWKGSE